MSEQCDGCRFWKGDGVTIEGDDALSRQRERIWKDYGSCVRFPPTQPHTYTPPYRPTWLLEPMSESVGDGFLGGSPFPVTHRENWCGEFQARATEGKP